MGERLQAIRMGSGAMILASIASALAADDAVRDTAGSRKGAVAPRRIQWVNTPVLLEAMERQRQGRLPHPLELWLLQLLEIPPDASPGEPRPGPHP